jgi:hypothetical protein
MNELAKIYEYIKSELRLNEPMYFTCYSEGMFTFQSESEDLEVTFICGSSNSIFSEMEMLDLLNLKGIEYFDLITDQGSKNIIYSIHLNLN